jgi:exodeoxyribonuclease VIII
MNYKTIFKNAKLLLNLDDKAYREIDAISQSDMKHLIVSPAHYKAYKEARKEETDAMRLGTATHLAVFQPQHFHDEVVLAPRFDKRTKEGKAGWELFYSNLGNKIAIAQEDFERCIDMSDVVRNNPLFIKYTASGNPEASLTADTSFENIKVKGRLDWLNYKDGIILDLKTIGDVADIHNIKKTLYKGYAMQSLFYLSLMESYDPSKNYEFIFCFVEKEPPHGVRFIKINPSSLLNYSNILESTLRNFNECIKNNVFPAYDNIVEVIDI